REEPAPLPTLLEAEAKAKDGALRPGTEAVEGEVEMEREREGFVHMVQVKISLMEWSEQLFDITTVSIHTYERAPQVLAADPGQWRGVLRVDSSSRCAALSLPTESFAMLPFHTAAELEMMDQERQAGRDIPYSPSFILDLGEVDTRIRNIIDFTFIPGFETPTMAVASQTTQTWTG
ncbi:mRNA cleavage and polyadenylation factor subunit, partial [Tulasnella sp. UAMH 9824]